MRHWIMRWLGWARVNARRLSRNWPRMLTATVSHQQAGLHFVERAVPWNADHVELNLLCRLPTSARRRVDFSLHISGRPALLPDTITNVEDDRHRLVFRFSPPQVSTRCELRFQQYRLASLLLLVVSARKFTSAIAFSQVALGVRLGAQTAVVPRFVARQGRGFVASAVITSAMPLASLSSDGLRVVFRNERSGRESFVEVPLSREQLQSREALVSAVLPVKPGLRGPGQVMWLVNGEVKAVAHVEGVSRWEFHQSLQVLDTKYVVADRQGHLRVTKPLPPLDEIAGLGPCFLLTSGERGIAGRCRLSLHAVVHDEATTMRIAEQNVLLTDAGLVFAPVLLDVSRLARIASFELRHRSRVLATLSLSPIPRATFNAEGAYKPPPEFVWSATAEEELNDRLIRLRKGHGEM